MGNTYTPCRIRELNAMKIPVQTTLILCVHHGFETLHGVEALSSKFDELWAYAIS
jgi:hypothetical protein